MCARSATCVHIYIHTTARTARTRNQIKTQNRCAVHMDCPLFPASARFANTEVDVEAERKVDGEQSLNAKRTSRRLLYGTMPCTYWDWACLRAHARTHALAQVTCSKPTGWKHGWWRRGGIIIRMDDGSPGRPGPAAAAAASACSRSAAVRSTCPYSSRLWARTKPRPRESTD